MPWFAETVDVTAEAGTGHNRRRAMTGMTAVDVSALIKNVLETIVVIAGLVMRLREQPRPGQTRRKSGKTRRR